MSRTHYDSIKELPLHNWRNLKDARYARIDFDTYGKTTPIKKSDHKAVEVLQEDFVSHFDFNKDLIKLNSITNKLLNAKKSAHIDGNRIALNEVRRYEFERKELLEKMETQKVADLDKTIITLENDRGFEIDEKKITVFKFYKLQEMYSEKMERLIAQQNKLKNG